MSFKMKSLVLCRIFTRNSTLFLPVVGSRIKGFTGHEIITFSLD